MAAGVLPAAALGLPGPRRARLATVVLGVLIGVSMTIGAFLCRTSDRGGDRDRRAVPARALAAPRGAVGRLMLDLCLPMVGIGLSFGAPAEAAGLGSDGARIGPCLRDFAALARATRPAIADDRRAAGEQHNAGLRDPTRPGRRDCGRDWLRDGSRAPRLGLRRSASGDAAGIRYGPRPRYRSHPVRAVRATAACVLVLADPANAVLTAAVVLAVSALAATTVSRRYVTGAFTTYVVFFPLLNGNPQDASHRFLERLSDTLLGVELALTFGVLIPRLRQRVSPGNPTPLP